MLKKSKVLFLFLFAMLVISNVFLYSNTEFLFTQNNNDKGELKQILFEHLKFSNSTLDKDLSNLLASVLEISEQRKEQTTHEKNVREIQRHLQVIHSLFDDKNSSHIQPDMKAVSDAKENNNNNSNRTLCPLSTLPSWRENNIPISNFNVKSEEMIGVNLIDQFRNSKIEYCVPRDDSADNNQMNSKITCFSNFLGEKFCEGENLLIDFTKIRENSKNRHVSLATGALLGNCNLDSSFNAETLFNYSTKTIMSSFESKDHLQCKEIIDTPTYFVSRYEYANVYHTMTDFANAFLASLVTQTKIENWQIVLFDFHAEVPLDEGWKDIFSPNREVKRVSDLIQHSNQIGGPICYRKAIFSLPGYLSPFRGTLQPFVHGDFFKAFSNFVKDKYHVLNSDAPLSPTITLISRHNYQTSPRKNDTKSLFFLINFLLIFLIVFVYLINYQIFLLINNSIY